MRDAIFYGRITKDFLPESVKRKTDWRLSVSEPLLPTGQARVGQRRTWKRNWFNIINQQGWLIGREDLRCLRIHIWDAPVILGGHGRHCKLILGKGVGQRTLPLSGLIPSWVTMLSRRVGTARLMHGCPQIKKAAVFFFFLMMKLRRLFTFGLTSACPKLLQFWTDNVRDKKQDWFLILKEPRSNLYYFHPNLSELLIWLLGWVKRKIVQAYGRWDMSC